MEPILSIQLITKSYGPILALNGVSFDVLRGISIWCAGAKMAGGKTTLLASILNVLIPDAGTYKWFGGMQPAEARKRIGSLLETPNFYHYYRLTIIWRSPLQ